MNKYRIKKHTIKNTSIVLDEYFTVEERFLFFFWQVCKYPNYHEIDFTVTYYEYRFNTEQEAIEKVNALKLHELAIIRVHETTIVREL